MRICALGIASLILMSSGILRVSQAAPTPNEGCVMTGTSLSNACISVLNNTRIAVVNSVFTSTPYYLFADSFYSFYRWSNQTGLSGCTSDNLDKLSTPVLTGWGVNWETGLKQFVNQSLASGIFSDRTLRTLTDIQVDAGALFNSTGARNYDVVIIGFSEYVTAREYASYVHFVATGGQLIVLSASSFVAEVSYDPYTNTETLVQGHGWSFDGTKACPGPFYRWYGNNTNWVGGNQCCISTMGYKINGAIFNTTDPESGVMRQVFGTVLFPTYVAHEDGSMTNSTGSSTIGYWNVTGLQSGKNLTIRVFSHSYHLGTVLYTGIFGNDLIGSDPSFQFLVYSSIVTSLYQSITSTVSVVPTTVTSAGITGATTAVTASLQPGAGTTSMKYTNQTGAVPAALPVTLVAVLVAGFLALAVARRRTRASSKST